MEYLKKLFGKRDTGAPHGQPANQKKSSETQSSEGIDLKQSSVEKETPENAATATIDFEDVTALIEKHFNMRELQDLCSELGVAFEVLPGDTKRAKVFSLTNYFNTPPRKIIQLIATVTKLRLNIDWNTSSPRPHLQMNTLYHLLNYCFNKNELMDLCLKLGIQYENLAGSDSRKAAELVDYMYRRGRIEELLSVGNSLRPKAPWYLENQQYEPYSVSQLDVLQQLVFDNFDEDAIRQLCVALDIDYKRLPEWEYGGTAREMVLYLARRERLDELIVICAEQKPQISWADVLAKPTSQTKEPKPSEEASVGSHTQPEPSTSIQNDPSSLRQALDAMDEGHLRTLCFDMGVDYENLLPGNRRVALLSLVQGQERIPALIQAIEFLMSDSE